MDARSCQWAVGEEEGGGGGGADGIVNDALAWVSTLPNVSSRRRWRPGTLLLLFGCCRSASGTPSS